MAVAGGTLVTSTIPKASRRETCLSDLPVGSGIDHEQIGIGRDLLALPWVRRDLERIAVPAIQDAVSVLH
jgi:hypothetical protein